MTEARMIPIVQSLEQYQIRVGEYPEKLEQLELGSMPKCLGRPSRYLYSNKDGEFRLLCPGMPLFNDYGYDSKTKTWINTD
jgi:hypothetical protein